MAKSTLLALSLAATAFAAPQANKSSWPGWNNIRFLFTFGDSYSQSGFDVHGTQPSPSNPIGNPPYPGWTSCNGPNWIDFLTTTYNASTLLTYNMAYGGATVDSALVAPFESTVVSMKNQIQTEFLPTYASRPASAPWTSESALFGFFIGINDVGNSWWQGKPALYDSIFSVYAQQVADLYAVGARNFVFLNVPPVNLSPGTLGNNDGGSSSQKEGEVIVDWNKRLANMVASFQAQHSDVTAFVFDTHSLFESVIKNPASYEQTAGLKTVTTYCKAYMNGASSWYAKDPSCPYPVNEYLWLNTLHPTFSIHNATASAIAKMLSK